MRKDRSLKECPYCSLDLKTITNNRNRGNHVRWCKSNPDYERFIKEAAERKRKPRTEESVSKSVEGLKKAWADGKFENIDFKGFKGHKHTSETKELMSEKKKEWCLNNKEKHNWSLRHRKSIPCEFLKNLLKEKNIIFIEEYMPLSNRLFQIDIAFPELKLGIEINGNQHYENGKLKPYYQERHDLITDAGWELYEFHYWEAFGKKIIEFIINRLNP